MQECSPLTPKYCGMTDLQELTEIGRRRQARRFAVIAVLLGTVAIAISVVVSDPTTTVGAVVLAALLLSVLAGLLLAYRLFFRVPGPELAFTGLPSWSRRDLLRRLTRGDRIEDDELQVADGLLTAARKPLLPTLFGCNAVLQLALALGRDGALHLFSGLSMAAATASILLRRRKLARRTDVVTRAYKQRYGIG